MSPIKPTEGNGRELKTYVQIHVSPFDKIWRYLVSDNTLFFLHSLLGSFIVPLIPQHNKTLDPVNIFSEGEEGRGGWGVKETVHLCPCAVNNYVCFGALPLKDFFYFIIDIKIAFLTFYLSKSVNSRLYE